MLTRLSNHAFWIKAALAVLIACLPAIAHAQRLPLKAYTTADGLPHNQINKIVRDSRGFLWFCTAEGLSLFDGYKFTNYGTNEGLPHRNVNDLLETRKGEIWLATNGGIVRLDPKGVPTNRVVNSRTTAAPAPMFTTFTPEGNHSYVKIVTTLLESHDGSIWCATGRGLFRLVQTGSTATLTPIDIKLPTEYPLSAWINSLHQDRHGTLWIGAASGLFRRWPDGKSAQYDRGNGLPDESIHDLMEDRHGNLWVGTRQAGLFRLGTGAGSEPPVVTRHYSRKNGLPSDWVFDLHESSDGRLWVASSSGLVEFPSDYGNHEVSAKLYTKRNGLSYHEIRHVMDDREGNLWMGSPNGAMKLARNGFLTFGEEDGIYLVHSFFESGTGDGELNAFGYVFGDQKGTVFEGAKLNILDRTPVRYWFSLGRFDGERFKWILPNALRNVGITWSDKPFITHTHTGQVWIGHFLFPRVSTFDELRTARPVSVYPIKLGTDEVVYSNYTDSRGDVWISTASSKGNGLGVWDHASRSSRDMAGTEGLPSLKEILPVSFQEDASRNLWVGFSDLGGLARYASGRFTVFTEKDGLPPGRINDLYSDRSGRLWIATSRGGLSRIDDPNAATPTFVTYSTEHGLSSNFTNVITEDLHGHIYVSTGRGIDRITPKTGRIKHFTSADGLASGEIFTAARDRHGALWFGTFQGVSRFVPEPEQPSEAPPILINSLRLAGEQYYVSALGESEIRLPDLNSNQNQLQIDFVGLSFASGETLRYQYMLEGADANWRASTDQRTVNYASLSPGTYKFLVRAVNSDGVVSPQPASVAFTVLRPIWQRWWFLALIAALLIAAAFALYRFRVARILELANVRTRIATDLHDDIGANLTKIAILSEVVKQQLGDRKGEKDDSLSSIARISRESVAAMSDIVWAVNPQRDSLRDLVRRMRRHAEEVFVTREIVLDFKAPEPNRKLGVNIRRDLFLIFKEAVNNAARHSGCSKVAISLAVTGQNLELEINDNGVGFDSKAESDGQGLTNMRERASKLGGELELTSDQPGGTRIRIRVPYVRSARFSMPKSD